MADIGEILVAGEHVNQGYYQDPEADRANKLHLNGRIWHRTGDTGYLDQQGRIWLVGRVKDMVGALHPFMVEGQAQSHPWMVRAALVEVEGAPVLACQVSDPPADWAQTLASQIGVEQIILVPSIPLDARHNAKIDRAATVESVRGRLGL